MPKCQYKNCEEDAIFNAGYKLYALCALHREFLDEVYSMYKDPEFKDCEIYLRRLVGYKLEKIFDTGHQIAAGVKRCKYCSALVGMPFWEGKNDICSRCKTKEDTIKVYARSLNAEYAPFYNCYVSKDTIIDKRWPFIIYKKNNDIIKRPNLGTKEAVEEWTLLEEETCDWPSAE